MTSARSTALKSAGTVAVVYLLACLVLNTLVGAHAIRDVDREVAETLATLRHASSSHPSAPAIIGYFGGSARIDRDDDLNRLPVAYWWVPERPGANGPVPAGAVPADSALPALPAPLAQVGRPVTTALGGSTFRIAGTTVAGGRWVVALSTAAAAHDVHLAELAELVFLPIVLAAFFSFALVVGRRAARPIEEARQRLLEFTADASHELRTPLSVIDAEVGLALSAVRDATSYRRTLEKVSSESHRLGGLVEELLWLARFDAGPRRPPDEAVELYSLAETASRRFTAVAAQRNITVDVVRDGAGSQIVRGPPEWLDRLVSVLVDNACRYSPPGSAVTVRVGHADGGPTLTVDDEGPGIPASERERIFHRFHRASQEKGGSGLGLAIADAIVSATGGHWTISSSPSGGARMQVAW